MSDEELLPHAIEEAVALFRGYPHAGAITRDGYVTDGTGNVSGEFIAGEFDFVDYLFGRYCPMFVASFFRRQALLDVGLGDDDWTIGCLEFEIWCRLGTQHTVKYVPGLVAKYGVDERQLSNSPQHFDEHLDNRAKVIEQLFSESGFFGEAQTKKTACLYNQHYLFYNHARAYRLSEQMNQLYDRMRAIVDRMPSSAEFEYNTLFAEKDSLLYARAYVLDKVAHLWYRVSVLVPGGLKRMLSKTQRAAVRRFAIRTLYYFLGIFAMPKLLWVYVREKWQARKIDGGRRHPGAPVYSKKLYHEVADRYYGRGQIDYAQYLWRKAEELDDVVIDSVAVQACLLSPTATNASLLERQKGWAARHAKPLAGLPPLRPVPYRNDRKIRVGYHCSFFDGDVLRAMFNEVARNHDRERVTAIAYSPSPAAKDIESAYDQFTVIGAISDRKFVERVRSDKVDILIEMSGFSPHHRFGAMASRCAPIQISYFNHTGTSAVRNVDYVLADAISVLPEDEPYFTEKVWRLEGDHLSFNYDWAKLPEPTVPPSVGNGYVTFGCFGSGGKVHDGLIELWARILRSVPGSRLYIRNSYLGRPVNREYMRSRFARHGVNSERLRLGGAEAWSEFIKSYEDVDISLDTWPYCGANTVGESVWQGVPVITLKGNRFSSRYGASHVTAAGCAELVAESSDRYVGIAVELAANPERLLRYRHNLRRMAREHGLSDPVRFARKLEKAFAEMMDASGPGRKLAGGR